MDIYFLLIIIVLYLVVKPFIINDLNAEEVRKKIEEGAVIIDVRTDGEYEASHLDSTVHIPLSDLRAGIVKTVPDKDKPILLHCRSGSRSFTAKRVLKGMGYSNVYNLGSFGRAKRMVGKS
jgi:rhodanese-related sulfurtransferase